MEKALCGLAGCEAPAKVRGRCKCHYNGFRWLVTKGLYTWRELEELDLVRPPYRVAQSCIDVIEEARKIREERARKRAI